MGHLEAFSFKESNESKNAGRKEKESRRKAMSEAVLDEEDKLNKPSKPKEEWLPLTYKEIPDHLVKSLCDFMRCERIWSMYYREDHDIYEIKICETGLRITKVETPNVDVHAPKAYKILRACLEWSYHRKNKNITTELPKVYVEIREKITDLETKYGFKIQLENPKGKEAKLEEVNAALDFLAEALGVCPYEVIKKAEIQNVYLLTELRDKNGAKLGGLQENRDIYIDVEECSSDKCGAYATFHHELFHLFDFSDYDEDNAKWKKQNPPGKKHYVHESGSKAILSGDLENGGKCVTDKEGFQRSYGYCGGVEEDQATVAEEIFSFKYKTDSAKKAYLERLVSDKWLRSKIEMVTGCTFNVGERKFSKLITEEEYKTRFKTSSYEYYPKWSKNDKGEPTMGLDFWNKILEAT